MGNGRGPATGTMHIAASGEGLGKLMQSSPKAASERVHMRPGEASLAFSALIIAHLFPLSDKANPCRCAGGAPA